jgi:adenosylmethionine-8-amino-7-oxononanoate aminotransferase
MSTFFNRSVVFVEGSGVKIKDEAGNEYINGMSCLWNVHCGLGRQEIIDAITGQLNKLAFCSISRVGNLPAIDLAEKLAAISPGNLNKVFLTNTGSEAVEAAIKMIRHYSKIKTTGKYKIISLNRSYHGVSFGALAASGIQEMKEPYEPLLPGFLNIPAPYCYRCAYGMKYPDCDIYCATFLEKTIREEGENTIGAFIIEPVMAFAGGIIPPDEYFHKIRNICDKYDIFLIFDEITTGFGRLGKMFAAEYWKISPDIITLSKGINSGYLPLGATLVTDDIYDAFTKESKDTWDWANMGIFAHGSTTDGHPVCCAAALANIEVIEKENLVDNSRTVGSYLLDKLKGLLKYPFVGEVRGLGLLNAIEFVRDKNTKEPLAPEQLFIISTRLFKSGLFAYSMGNTITLFPPLIFTTDDVDQTYEIFEKVLSKVQRMLS